MNQSPGDQERPSPHDLPTMIQGDVNSQEESTSPIHVEFSHGKHLESSALPLSRVGDYELLGEIGQGGMGVVFRARHVHLNRIVALKVLSGGLLAKAENVQRFATEAAAAAQLQHPNIVALYEIGNHENQPFYSMEYVEGTSLAYRSSMGVLPSRLAASYLERTARAVHYAHTRGIIHRDLKPANVLLDEQDQPKITDFGLAKVIQSDSGQTRTGSVIGTPSYMAPEQANASKDLGTACDIYSLGAILYELMTGHPPFLGETPLATLQMVSNQDPVPPHLINPEVNRDLETICLKCLEKDPGKRYSSAEALGEDLRRFLKGEPIHARRSNTLQRAMKWVRRKPATAGLLLVTATALLGFALFEWRVAAGERILREEAEVQKKKAEAREKLLQHLYYLGQMRQVFHSWGDADLQRCEQLLDYWIPKHSSPDLRDWEWYFLESLCTGRNTYPGHVGKVTSLAYSPDGNYMASAGGNYGRPGEIKIWETATGKMVMAFPQKHTNVINQVVYSPDGRWIASASDDRTIRIWDARTGKDVAVIKGHFSHITGIVFSRDGTKLISIGGDKIVLIWDLQSIEHPRILHRLHEHNDEITSIAASSRDDLFATASLDGTVKIWDLKKARVDRTLRGHRGEVRSLVFSPTGKILITGGGSGDRRGEVHLWDVATGLPVRTHYGLSDRILAVAVSSKGHVAAAGSDGIVHLWDERRSSEPTRFRADTQLVYAMAFDPGGERFSTGGGDGRIRVWNSSGGQETYRLPSLPQTETIAYHPNKPLLAAAGRYPGKNAVIDIWDTRDRKKIISFTGHSQQIRSVAFSPQGSRLASGGDDETVRIFNLEKKAEVLELIGHEGRVMGVSFSPDGKMVASASEDDTVRVWNVETGQQIRIFRGHRNGVLAVQFSPKGRFLASASYDKTIRLWEVANGESRVLEGHTGSVYSVAFSPDETQIASASSDHTIRIWDVQATGEGTNPEVVFRLQGSTRPITALAYHPRGRRLVSVGVDRIIRLWDLVTGQEILQLKGPEGSLRSVCFRPDGRQLATVGDYSMIYVWDAFPNSQKEESAP